MAQLAAQAAARAEGVVDLYFAAHHADSRTAKLHAGLAAHAFFGLCLNGAGVLDVFEQGTRTAGDNNRRFICGKFLFDRFVAGSKIIRINDLHTPDANGMAQGFLIDFRARISLEIEAGRRILLVSGHASDGVVKDDHG